MTNHLLCQFNNKLDCPCKQGAKESTERRLSTDPLHGISSIHGTGSQTVTLNLDTSNTSGVNFANFLQNPSPVRQEGNEWNVPEDEEVITVDDVFNHLERDR